MIFYLSCTGNTLWAAQAMAEATGDRLVDITALPPGENCFSIEPEERVGFCFPVHGWRPPFLVRKFIQQLHLALPGNAEDSYFYALCTAGDTIGETMELMEKDLRQAGYALHARFSLIMPESYVGLPFMDVDTPENERRKIDNARRQLKDITRLVANRQRGVEQTTRGRWPKTNTRLLGGFFLHRLVTDRPFRVEASRCIACGKCKDTCPVGNIGSDGNQRPVWLHNGNCLSCFSCFHHCPVHAIEYGNRTKHKGQYYFRKRNT